MSTHRTIERRLGNRATADLSFGIHDERGREFGIQFRLSESRFEDAPESAFIASARAPGHYFVVRPQSTRDGFPFGPIQREMFFASEAERAQYIEQRTARARKAAEKKAKEADA